jgi:hypothetical protein
MAGGLIQLAVYGTQDVFLTGTPQISFFKIVYRRHTNFSIESIKQTFFGTTNFGFDLTCIADRIGDLIYKTYLEIDIPSVALDKNPSLYTLTQAVAKSQLDTVNDFYQIIFNYVTANSDLTRKLAVLVRTNNLSVSDIIDTMNDTINFEALASLIKARAILIDFIINSTEFNSIIELRDQKMDFIYQINRVDIKILFDSVVSLTTDKLIGAPQADIDLSIKKEIIRVITTVLYPELQNFYLKVYDLKITKENIHKSFVDGTYVERYKFAWVEELGHSIIDKLDLKIGNQIVDTHTGDWMIMWNKITVDVKQKVNYDKLIGQIPTLITFDDGVKPAYKLVIPLQFWFCRHNGLALPLVALRYHDVVFELRLKKLEQCCYVEDDPNLLDIENIQNLYGINLTDVSLYIDYVFLDTDERRRFAQSTHEYLIETVQYNEFSDLFGKKYNATVVFSHPCKFILWFCQPLSYRINPTGRNKCQWNNYGVNPDKTGDTLTKTYIQLNSYQRTDSLLDPVFYNYVDGYFHFKTSAMDGLYNYSFALKPMELQPSSTCNMSRIDNLGIMFEFSTEFINLVENQIIEGFAENAFLGVYTMSYNVLRIASGMAGLAFQVST